MMASTDNAGLVRRLFEKHNQGADAVLEAYDEFFHPELEWTPTIVGGPERATYRGRDGLARWYAERDDSFGEARVEIEECRAVGRDVVVLLGRSLATGRASGAEVIEEVGIVFGFDDGRIRIDRACASHREAEEAAQELAAEAHA
jgi:ketosteroid isomerase-like protein